LSQPVNQILKEEPDRWKERDEVRRHPPPFAGTREMQKIDLLKRKKKPNDDALLCDIACKGAPFQEG